jgi:hypothetical protein
MRKFDSRLKDIGDLAHRWIEPIADPLKMFEAVLGYVAYCGIEFGMAG